LKRLLPDTIFGRLFALVLAAIIVSHLMTFVLLLEFFDDHHDPRASALHDSSHKPPPELLAEPRPHHPPPPRIMIAGRAVPPPPPGLWIGVLMQILALSVAAWFGSKVVARPIQRLAQAATQLGENLNNPPIPEDGTAEARQAAHGFNDMQRRIRSHIEERGRFLAAVSHDLRTPLTRMKLRVERLNEETTKEKLRDDITEMAAMLDATLDYLRGEASSEPWQLLDIHALMESMAEDAQENGQDLTVIGSAQPLLTKPTAVRRCLSNLVENALRYGVKATIVMTDDAQQLVIAVRDCGPGIPEEQMEAVFEPFFRLESSRNKSFGGVGLGLAIARESAGQCRSQLTLRNAPQGGLIATLVMPRKT
jgi:signal transduction histidine kinase